MGKKILRFSVLASRRRCPHCKLTTYWLQEWNRDIKSIKSNRDIKKKICESAETCPASDGLWIKGITASQSRDGRGKKDEEKKKKIQAYLPSPPHETKHEIVDLLRSKAPKLHKSVISRFLKSSNHSNPSHSNKTIIQLKIKHQITQSIQKNTSKPKSTLRTGPETKRIKSKRRPPHLLSWSPPAPFSPLRITISTKTLSSLVALQEQKQAEKQSKKAINRGLGVADRVKKKRQEEREREETFPGNEGSRWKKVASSFLSPIRRLEKFFPSAPLPFATSLIRINSGIKY